METWMWILIAAFVVADSIVTMVVLRKVRARRTGRSAPPPADPPGGPTSRDELAKQIGLE